MQPADRFSRWSVVHSAGGAFERHIWGVDASVNLLDLTTATSLAGGVEQLRGRSVLIRTRWPPGKATASTVSICRCQPASSTVSRTPSARNMPAPRRA